MGYDAALVDVLIPWAESKTHRLIGPFSGMELALVVGGISILFPGAGMPSAGYLEAYYKNDTLLLGLSGFY